MENLQRGRYARFSDLEGQMTASAPEISGKQRAAFLRRLIEINMGWYSFYITKGDQNAADNALALVDKFQKELDEMEKASTAAVTQNKPDVLGLG